MICSCTCCQSLLHNALCIAGLSPSDLHGGSQDNDHHDDGDDELMEAEDMGGWTEVRERTSKKKEPEVRGWHSK